MSHYYTIIVADDHPLFRVALTQAIGAQVEGVNVLEAEHLQHIESQMNNEIDLVMLDLHMPGANGFSGLIYLRTHYPSVPVVVVSGNEQASVIHRAMHFGAVGFIPKSASMANIIEAVQVVLDGGQWVPKDLPVAELQMDAQDSKFADQLSSLTPQQFKVLVMLTEGLLNKQIAYELSVSEATVKAHVTAILRKLGVHSRTQAVIMAGRLRIEHPQDEVVK